MRRAAVVLLALLVAGSSWAGVEFDADDTEFYKITSHAPASSMPATVYCYSELGASNGYQWSEAKSGDEVATQTAITHWAGDSKLYASLQDNAVAASAVTANTATGWAHCVAQFVNEDSRIVVLNGDWANRGTDTTDLTIAAGPPNTTYVGKFRDEGASDAPFDGVVAWVAIYGAQLTQDQIESLSSGAWSPYVASESLASFYLLNGADWVVDPVGGKTLAKNGSPPSAGIKSPCPRPGVH